MAHRPICPVCLYAYAPNLKRKYCSDRCMIKAKKKREYEQHSKEIIAKVTDWQKANKDKRKETSRRYYEKHKEEIARKAKVRNKSKTQKEREKLNLRQKAFYQRNKEIILAKQKTVEYKEERNLYKKEWRKRNFSKVRGENARYKNKKKFGGNRFIVLWRDKHSCQDCGVKAQEVHHLDGSGQTDNPNNSLDNLVTLCKSCHAKRHQNQNHRFTAKI